MLKSRLQTRANIYQAGNKNIYYFNLDREDKGPGFGSIQSVKAFYFSGCFIEFLKAKKKKKNQKRKNVHKCKFPEIMNIYVSCSSSNSIRFLE